MLNGLLYNMLCLVSMLLEVTTSHTLYVAMKVYATHLLALSMIW